MMRQGITFQREVGQTMAEYAVVLGVITLAVVTTFSLLSAAIDAAFNRTLSIITSIV